MEPLAATSQLGSNEFLTLFLTQMQYQDPLEPMDNSAFLAQLAQFSSLEQLGKQTDLLTGQANNLKYTQTLQEINIASSLIGKDIVYRDAAGVAKEARVDGVALKPDGVYFKAGDELIPVSQLEGIQ